MSWERNFFWRCRSNMASSPPLSRGRGHQRLTMVENSFIVKMRVLIFLWFVAHISKILLMVYLFPPKVIRTETNMDIEAKSKIKMFYFLSLTWRLIGEWRDRSGLVWEFTVQRPARTRENTKIFRKELVISCLIVLRFKAHIKVPATKARKTSLQIGLSREVYKTLWG